MSLIRKHGAVLQAWACLALVTLYGYGYLRLLGQPSKRCKQKYTSYTVSVILLDFDISLSISV